MKRERLLLTVLGVVFLVELAIGIPALWSEYAGDREAASSVRLVAVTPLRSDSSSNPSASPMASNADPRAATQRPVTLRTLTPSARTVTLALPTHAQRVVAIDDMPQAGVTASFTYAGHWEHVRAVEDGRTGGTSSRSFQPGSVATLTFRGTEVRLFGVCGPSGGRAAVTLDGRRIGSLASFYAVEKETHMLVYASPRLRPGRHRLSIWVASPEGSQKTRYVNIDGAEYD